MRLDVALSAAPLIPVRPALLDALGQQAAWWGAVLLVRSGDRWMATLPPLLLVAAHVALRREGRSLIPLAAAGALVGFVGDSVLVRAGVLGTGGPLAAPWMTALWAAFALALGVSLRFLRDRPVWLQASLGALAGPIAYRSGQALGALDLASPPLGLGVVAVGWAIAVPLLSWVARRLDQSSPPPRSVP